MVLYVQGGTSFVPPGSEVSMVVGRGVGDHPTSLRRTVV